MNENKPTPGPWKYKPTKYDATIWAENGNMMVAQLRGWGYLTGKGHLALGLSSEEAARIQDANGFLIAAAQELLAACKAQERVDNHIAECEDCSDGAFPELCPEGFPLADEARLLRRAAIAKAEGKETSD